MSAIHVVTRPLTNEEGEALLAKHHVGSMALAFHDRVTIALSNYAYADRRLYGRMENGPDLATVQHHRWVAFEVSEIRGIYDWRTVTANGSVQLLSDAESSRDAEEFREALTRLRSVVPAILTARDPMPQRVQLFRLDVNELVGWEVNSNARDTLPAP